MGFKILLDIPFSKDPGSNDLGSTLKCLKVSLEAMKASFVHLWHVQIHTYIHCLFKSGYEDTVPKEVLADQKARLYTKCYLLHDLSGGAEKPQKGELILRGEKGKQVQQVDPDFKEFLDSSQVYFYRRATSVRGDVFALGDFVVRLGVFEGGETMQKLFLELEYLTSDAPAAKELLYETAAHFTHQFKQEDPKKLQIDTYIDVDVL